MLKWISAAMLAAFVVLAFSAESDAGWRRRGRRGGCGCNDGCANGGCNTGYGYNQGTQGQPGYAGPQDPNLAPIPAGASPNDWQVGPDGRRIYVGKPNVDVGTTLRGGANVRAGANGASVQGGANATETLPPAVPAPPAPPAVPAPPAIPEIPNP